MAGRTHSTKVWTLKSGVSKGNRRMWAEGEKLKVNGFTKGMKLGRSMVDGSVVLTILRPGEEFKGRKHSIAGTLDRPILDLTGKWVSEFMGSHTHFIVTVTDAGITLTPVTLEG